MPRGERRHPPLPNRLRDIREGRGLGLLEVSKLTGFNANYLSRVERGTQDMNDYDKLRIAAFYDLPLTEIFFVVDGPVDVPGEAVPA